MKRFLALRVRRNVGPVGGVGPLSGPQTFSYFDQSSCRNCVGVTPVMARKVRVKAL